MTYDERLSSMDSKIEHLRKVTQMHRRLIDLLVRDMLEIKPKLEESRVEPELRNPAGELI
jgi:hypothetical protein